MACRSGLVPYVTLSCVPLDRESPRPLYQQLADILREQIEAGARVIPSSKRLATEYDIAEVTARQAVDLLKAEGLVEGSPGKGTYVIQQDD